MPPRLVNALTRLAGCLRTRRGVALLALLVGTLVLLFLIFRGQAEPSHQKLSASEWLELVNTNQSRIVEVTTAFRAMGPAGAEYLGNELLREPSQLHEWLLARHQQIPGPFKPFLLKPQRQRSRTDTILELLSGLGTNAAPAIPKLITWLDTVGPALITSAPLPTNGFSIATNNVSVLGFAHGITSRGSKTGRANVLLVPAKSIVTLQTQSIVSAPGLVTTNVTVTVKSASPALPRIAFQILTNLGSEDPRACRVLLTPVERMNYYLPPVFGPNLKKAAASSLPLLLEHAESKDRNRKLAALGLLRLTLPESVATREFMIQKLNDQDAVIFDTAIGALRSTTNELERIIPSAVRGLVSRNNGLSIAQRSPAFAALKEFSRHSPLVIPQLQQALGEADYYGKLAALELLGEIGTATNVDLTLIKSFTLVPEEPIIAQAWLTLGRVTRDDEMIAQGYLMYLNMGRDFWQASIKLGELGPAAHAAVPRLLTYLTHQDERIVAKAAETLGKIGPAAKDALPQLEALRNHPHLMVREPVEEAIRLISAPPKAKGAE